MKTYLTISEDDLLNTLCSIPEVSSLKAALNIRQRIKESSLVGIQGMGERTCSVAEDNNENNEPIEGYKRMEIDSILDMKEVLQVKISKLIIEFMNKTKITNIVVDVNFEEHAAPYSKPLIVPFTEITLRL